MNEPYDFSKHEVDAESLWASFDCFTYEPAANKPTFSMFLVPPNASGPMHIGNALMVALQDILARYHRARGYSTLWLPGLDHGGYETQVTYERMCEAKGVYITREAYPSKQLYDDIHDFVEVQKRFIVGQLERLGASVDLTKLRYTLDETTVSSVYAVFQKMVDDGLIYRKQYMVHFCPACSTVLADVELKKQSIAAPHYQIAFSKKDASASVAVATYEPETLFSVTHLLVHPEDERYAALIGERLLNPITNEVVTVVASKRPLQWHREQTCLPAFCPSFDRYDYEYAIRNDIPVKNCRDWDGTLAQRYPGKTLEEARKLELVFLEDRNSIVAVTDGETELYLCKKGHPTSTPLAQSWFLNIDGPQISLRKLALDAMSNKKPSVYPEWRRKGLTGWFEKMIDWPIARQNAWGIRMPIWYVVEDPADFVVWFFDQAGVRHNGNLQRFLQAGIQLEEIINGLQRVQASEHVLWTTQPKAGVLYIPETDTFDTWFSSGGWSVYAFEGIDQHLFPEVYPSASIIIGHDLLRLSVARKIMLSVYMTGKMPFPRVYLHPLILGNDGQKMSKSIGNVVTLEHYIETYGADVTRMALTSYMDSGNDFILDSTRLQTFADFIQNVWRVSHAYNIIREHDIHEESVSQFDPADFSVVTAIEKAAYSIGRDIEQHRFARAQAEAVGLFSQISHLADQVIATGSVSSAAAFLRAFKTYLVLLHPFAPHITEAVYQQLIDSKEGDLLAQVAWPQSRQPVIK